MEKWRRAVHQVIGGDQMHCFVYGGWPSRQSGLEMTEVGHHGESGIVQNAQLVCSEI